MEISGKINNLIKSIIIIVALVFAWMVYSNYDKKNSQPEYSFPEVQEFNSACQGKTDCWEMTSCKEAKFYLLNCPDTRLDPDGDGIPCESGVCAND